LNHGLTCGPASGPLSSPTPPLPPPPPQSPQAASATAAAVCSTPGLLTSLLLNAAACYLERGSSDDPLAPHNALHLATAALCLEPRCSGAHLRVALALDRLGIAGGGPTVTAAAHAFMAAAADLARCKPAEARGMMALLTPMEHSPSSPAAGGEVGVATGSGSLPSYAEAHATLLGVLLGWAAVMQELAPSQVAGTGDDAAAFQLWVPGGLQAPPPAGLLRCEAIAAHLGVRREAAAAARTRANAAFFSGDTAAALTEYSTGIDQLRALGATLLAQPALLRIQQLHSSGGGNSAECQWHPVTAGGAQTGHEKGVPLAGRAGNDATLLEALRPLLMLWSALVLFPFRAEWVVRLMTLSAALAGAQLGEEVPLPAVGSYGEFAARFWEAQVSERVAATCQGCDHDGAGGGYGLLWPPTSWPTFQPVIGVSDVSEHHG
jgi:hypothetical protein